MTSFCPKVVNMTTLIGPKRVHKHEIHILPRDLACPRGPRVRQDCEQLSEPRVILIHSGVTLRALGVYESYFGVILIRFQKTLVFPTYSNEFTQTTG